MTHDNTHTAWHINTMNCELEQVYSFESEQWHRLVAVADYQHRPLVTARAHQPSSIHFPQREFGKTSVVKRSFQPKWFQWWSWLHYDEDRDLAFCFACVVVYQKNLLQSAHFLEQAFISTGFSNWKDATAKFSKHEVSRCDKDSVLKTIRFPLQHVMLVNCCPRNFQKSGWSDASVY